MHINLNDEWKYSSTFHKDMIEIAYEETEMETVRIPHSNVQLPYNYFDETVYQFVSCYRKHIKADKEWKGRQVLITFEGVAHVANLYLNGSLVTTHYGGYTAFTADLASYLIYDEDNVLTVEVESRESSNVPPFGYVIDYLTYGGIYREVYLDVKEQISIEDAFIITKDISKDYEENQSVDKNLSSNKNISCDKNLSSDKNLSIDKNLSGVKNLCSDKNLSSDKYQNYDKNQDYDKNHNNNKNQNGNENQNSDNDRKTVEIQMAFHGNVKNARLKLKYYIVDTANIKIYHDIKPVTEQCQYITFEVEGVRNWEINDPNLYYLHLELFQAPKVGESKEDEKLDEKIIRFGFRSCEFKKDGFYLNHKKIKLIGLNRHQSYPYVGYAMPKRMQQLDAQILKEELQVNTVRTSHYPQSKHFIDRCDELGLLVFTEIPGWQHVGDDEWKKRACENVKEMVLQYRNHPSVILWGVRINESLDDDEFYKKTNSIAHELDPSRQTGGVRYLKKSSLLEDVYTFNDFIHNGKTKGIEKKEDVTADRNVPYIVTEFNGHMFPTKSFDNEEHRLEHALRHACVLDAVFEQHGVAGGYGWCMFDYNTHKDFGSGDMICYHGVMDMFRNPKLAAAVYASQGDKSDVCVLSSSLDIGEHPACNIGDIYVFTNADSVRLYKNDTFIKEFYPADSKYTHLPHPPILIDDFVGDLLEEKEHYSHKTAEILKEVLFAVQKYGQNNLPLKYKLKMAGLIIKEHLDMNEGVRLYYQYIGSWGGAATTFRIEAVKNNKVVKVIEKKSCGKPRLKVDSKSTVLKEEETYDVAEVRITVVDEQGNHLPYYQEPVTLQAWGSVELIGPKVISLKGGAAGTYVKTKGIQGEGGLTIYQADLGKTEIKFNVLV